MYAGSIAAGRTMYAVQVLSKVPHKERYAGPPGWGMGMGLESLPHKNSIVSNSGNREAMAPKRVKFHRRR